MAEQSEISWSDGRKSQNTRRRISERHSGAGNPFYGKKHSAEFRAAQSIRTKTFNANRTYDIEAISCRTLTDIEAAYLAGIVDGEGSITMPVGRKGVTIIVYNTSVALMDWLTQINGKRPQSRQPRGNNLVTARVPIYSWQATRARDVFYLLTAMNPHLKIKREKCDRALMALKAKYGDRLHG